MSKDKSPKSVSSLRFGSKEWGEQWMANIREAWKDYESLDEALSAMEKEEWPKPGELGRPLK